MDPADHYLDLVRLGRDAFLASAAPAALIRARHDPATPNPTNPDEVRDSSLEIETETFLGAPDRTVRKRTRQLEIYPLAKKPNAPFPEMITIGRTPNNDIVLRDATVSRLHAFFRHGKGDADWQIADGGSKNGTFVDGLVLAPRKERPVASGQVIKIGDLELTFYTAAELFKLLSLLAPERAP